MILHMLHYEVARDVQYVAVKGDLWGVLLGSMGTLNTSHQRVPELTVHVFESL